MGGWYLVITEEMRAAGLAGNRLLVFACIAGYSRDGQGAFFGSIDYVSEVCGLSRRTAIRTLQELESEGFISSKKRAGSSTLYAITDKVRGCQNGTGAKMTRVPNLHGGCAKMAPNNKIINNNSLISIKEENKKEEKEGGRFIPPTIGEVEDYAAAKGYTISAEAFVSYYTANGWKVGRNAMKDWRAAVRTWAIRESRESRESREEVRVVKASAPRRPESSYAKMQALLNQTNAEIAEWEGASR